MEESEKRRERLKAMRAEAAQSGSDGAVGNSVWTPQSLTNPLIETSRTPPGQELSAAPRFDYYTNPMAAFSANERRNKVSHQVSQDNYTPPTGVAPSPCYQQQSNYFLDQRMFHARGVYHNSSPLGSPIGTASPFSSPQGKPPQAHGLPGGTFNPRVPYNSLRGVNYSSPGFGQVGTPGLSYGRGRGHRFNSSPRPLSGRGGSHYYDSGRGRNQWHTPGSGQSGRKGFGSRACMSAESRPDLYYSRSMLEDPWQLLTPVIWKRKDLCAKSLVSPESLNPCFPKSTICNKRTRASDATSKSSPQPSLAEYLAASFNEAANTDVVNGEPGVLTKPG